MIDAAFAVPGNITLPTGGYAYARKIFELLPDYGVNVKRIELSQTFPHPDNATIAATSHIFAQLPPTMPILVDGLAYGAMPPMLVDQIASPITALVHHPLAYETGVVEADKRRFIAFETHALKKAAKVIANSQPTARLLMREYGVLADKLTVAQPGTEAAPRATGSGSPYELLAIGAVIPRKGYTVLIDALSQMTCRDWRLTIVGATSHNPIYTNKVHEAIAQAGLYRQVELTGAISDHDLQVRFSKADVFVMPSLFEGYGMVLSEAVARGLPIVCSTGGAMAETVSDDIAIKVPPGDVQALAKALDIILIDGALRKKLSDASWAEARRLPSWNGCASVISNVLKSLSKQTNLRVSV